MDDDNFNLSTTQNSATTIIIIIILLFYYYYYILLLLFAQRTNGAGSGRLVVAHLHRARYAWRIRNRCLRLQQRCPRLMTGWSPPYGAGT